MRESFVFHADFIDHLPEELKTQWAMYCINYGLYETEPQFEDVLHAELWRKLKDRMDADSEAYNKKLATSTEYNRYRKLLKTGEIAKGTTFEEYRNSLNNLNILNISNNLNNSTDTLREYDSVSDSEYVSEYEYVSVSDAPSTLTDSQKNYSNKIFNIFKEAGLPCSKGNELTFMQTDFKNAISYIHNSEELKNFSSQDIVQACKNFVTVYKNEQCYLKNKWNFFALVKSKSFYNLLPGNFDIENFYNFQSKQSKAEEEKPEEKKVYSFKPCPSCKAEMKVFWNQNKNKYECDNCHKLFGFDEYLGEL